MEKVSGKGWIAYDITVWVREGIEISYEDHGEDIEFINDGEVTHIFLEYDDEHDDTVLIHRRK